MGADRGLDGAGGQRGDQIGPDREARGEARGKDGAGTVTKLGVPPGRDLRPITGIPLGKDRSR